MTKEEAIIIHYAAHHAAVVKPGTWEWNCTEKLIDGFVALGMLQLSDNTGPPDHQREHDVYVKARAANNADAPYLQETCARYPWAAAARISYLEQQLLQIRKLAK